MNNVVGEAQIDIITSTLQEALNARRGGDIRAGIRFLESAAAVLGVEMPKNKPLLDDTTPFLLPTPALESYFFRSYTQVLIAHNTHLEKVRARLRSGNLPT